MTPAELQKAIIEDDVEAVRAALAENPKLARAVVDPGSLETALHIAASYGCKEIAELLLDAGADVNAEAALDYSPLDSADRARRLDIVDLLKSRGGLSTG